VVVINRAMARASWPGQSPIGARLKIGLFDSTMAEWMTVVGVVEDTRQVTLDRQGAPELFIAVAQHPVAALNLCVVARTTLDPLLQAETLRQQARAIDPEVPVKVTSAERMVTGSLRGLRFVTLLIALFAAAALALATLEVAGVMACVVAERRAEVGIRMAIGAHAGQILREFLGRALRLTALGLGCGLALSLAGGRVLRGLLFGVGATDPVTFLAVSALLTAALAAAAWPAVRASRTSPMTVLRIE
jgi:putative ABC transport system permease protein